ncbi:electron transfer flavoprotein subunit alpha [Vibrio olivae]|uniref:Electron transfer flavoprotein subunit alpha/FixB family protein n=1 Tax=Vibrio olivae TaxID=1243002 RepID=A0ABV5HJA9_9VIBR
MSDDIIRRDPRLEWIARNRLHPEHQALAQAGGKVYGPTGLERRNPHQQGFIGPNGIKRIDRLNAQHPMSLSGHRMRGAANAEVELPLHTVSDPDFYVVVVPDMVGGRFTSHDLDVLGQAHKLVRESEGAGAVMAVVFGEHREDRFEKAGVDRLLHLSGNEFQSYVPERKTALLCEVDAQYQPRFWLFPDSSAGGFELGRRLAARLGERPATQVWHAEVSTCIGRGAGGLTDIHRQTPKILLMLEECAEPIDETRHQALTLALDDPEAIHAGIRDLGFIEVDPNAIPLSEAEFILSAGNGVNDWPLFHLAAQELGATEGASRVAVDDGNMPRFRQVGATGTWVTARVYVAVGISGAVQHLQGIGQCDKVIAINTDLGCDMVKRAALSVIGDSSEVMQALVELVQAHRQQEARHAA